jgi:hypothetical protein
MHRSIRLTLALLVGALFVVPFGTAAHAAEPDCKTVTSHLVNRPDNGHGTPAVWALDTVDRTVKVCHVEPEVAAKVAIDTWTYSATLTDTGTFKTQPSAHGSPNAGAQLLAQTGTVHGEATFATFTAPHDWGYWNDTALQGKTFTGSAPSGTSDWVKHLWTDGFSGTQIADYSWNYATCTEQWVDSSAEGNDDGQADSAGDITGKACPSPSPSPSHSTAAPTVSASPAAGASLPVTGNRPWLYAGAGLLALGLGVAFVIAGRSKRRNFQA